MAARGDDALPRRRYSQPDPMGRGRVEW
jgi:hypothetical protein